MAAGLNKGVIVDAAFALLDVVGIEGLTVRALAAELGVKAPALYWHLASKQVLLDEMGTEVARRIAESLHDLPAEITLAEGLRAYGLAMRTEYLRHRDGARTFSGTRLTNPDLLRSQEEGLRHWIQRGHDLHTVVSAFELITAFVVGFVIEEQERAQSGAERYSIERRDAIVGEDRPLAREAGHVLFSPPEERFRRHLDTIIRAVAEPRST